MATRSFKEGLIKPKVKAAEYVWMEKGKHGTYVHPRDVGTFQGNGYKVAKKPAVAAK